MSRTKARHLRKNMTDAERTLWRHLRLRQFAGYKFRRQQPIGKYIVDFVCFERKLVVELDGSQHSEELVYDLERSAWLEKQGFRILRFWDNQVFNETDGVKEAIIGALNNPSYTPHLNPPPQGGRRLGVRVP
jgi:adenine-specific DNA-methyltransferase